MNLYHYTDIKDIQMLYPSFFGNNSFTVKDKQICSINRNFFYTQKNCEALLLGSQYIYNCNINDNKIYNLITDKKHIINKCYNKYNIIDYNLLLNTIKKLGYKGILYNVCNYNIVCLFYPIKVKLEA